MQKRKKYWKEKLSKRQEEMRERAKLLKAQEKLRQKRVLQQLDQREKALREFNRAKAVKLQEKATQSEQHRTKVIKKSADQSSEIIKAMLLKQKQADERRQQYQAQREKEAAMRQTLFMLKKQETANKLKRIQRVKENQNDERLRKIKAKDELREKEKRLKDAVLNYKLRSNDVFKEELEAAKWLGNEFVPTIKLRELEAETASKKFGLERLDKEKLAKLNTKTPRSIQSPKSGVVKNMERKKLTMRYKSA